MEKGFYKVTSDAYHTEEPWADYVSRSILHKVLRSPQHALFPDVDKPALAFGRPFHTYVLENELFDSLYAVKPLNMSFATKEGKKWRDENEGLKEIIPFEDNLKIQAMYMSLRLNKTAKALLSNGDSEISGCWPDPKFPEIWCKCRIDWVNKEQRVLVDLKTVRDCRTFERDAWKFGYDMEAAWYCYGATQITGVEHNAFYFICVEKEPPFGVMVYRATDELLGMGLERCSKAMEIIKECQDTNVWPGYPDTVTELYPPAWAKKEEGVTWN